MGSTCVFDGLLAISLRDAIDWLNEGRVAVGKLICLSLGESVPDPCASE